ncbi:MAG: hypothetical protein AAF726_06850 [Planctomycetota bacterium]
MTELVHLDSTVEIVGTMASFGDEVVREEPSLAWSTRDHAREHGGPLTRAFLDALPDEWRADDVAIQVKATWLKRGWTAGPIGFHCDWLETDDVGRRTNPDQEWPQAICAVVGGNAPTRFIVGSVDLPAVPTQADQSREWKTHLDECIERGEAREERIPPSTLFRFGPCSLHGRSRAAASGWRVILRALKTPGRTPHVWNQRWDSVQNGCVAATPEEAARLGDDAASLGAAWSFAHVALEAARAAGETSR